MHESDTESVRLASPVGTSNSLKASIEACTIAAAQIVRPPRSRRWARGDM
jgi:hypothetical protein